MYEVIEALGGMLSLVMFGVVIRRFTNSRTSIVIQRFDIKRGQDVQDSEVNIIGRAQGLVAFFLTTIGLSPTTHFTVDATEVRCRSTSLFGESFRFIPLRCVTVLGAGTEKPLMWMLLAVAAVFGGGVMSAVLRTLVPLACGIIFGAAFFIAYFVSKKFFVEIFSPGGPSISLLFAPNVLEGVTVDLNRAVMVIDVIRGMVLGGAPATSLSLAAIEEPDLTDLPSEDRIDEDNPFAAFEQQFRPPEEPRLDLENTALNDFEEARRLAKVGRRGDAVALLRRLVRKYPTTRAADNARRTLAKGGEH